MQPQRLILWVIFTVSVIFLWDNWQHFNGHASLFFGAGSAPQAATAAPQSDVPGAIVPATVASASTGTPGALPAASIVATGQDVSIRTDLLKVDFNTQGGDINQVELLAFRDTVDAQKNMLILEKTQDHTYVAQTGLIGEAGFPNHNTIFTLEPGERTLAPGQSQLEISFSAQAGGVRIVKTYIFARDSYEIGVRNAITNVGDTPVSPELYLQLVRDDSKPPGSLRFYTPYFGPAVFDEASKFQKVSFEDIEKGRDRAAPRPATDGWIAILQHYFVAAWIPPPGVARTYVTQAIGGSPNYRAAAIMPLGAVAPNGTVTNFAKLFVGPEDERLLEKTAPGLDLVRDYGWTTILARPVFWLLEKLYEWIGNWGWAIIGLTLIIKLAFFPLSAASYRSMARMKAVAPRLKALQEKYPDDRAKMNQAMMEMYREEKINPMGGCLPILIQIPVFIALYSVLSASVEMRGSPWLGWIHDLAAADPWYLLPALMMVSMFVQYKLNPAPPDPVQAKMMLIMPLVFGAMFFFFPAGLVLYYVVNNVLSILQQWQITRMMGQPKAAKHA